MADGKIAAYRKMLTLATVTVLVCLSVTIMFGLSAPGNWISVQEDGMQIEQNGMNVTLGCDIVVTSSMPYDMDDLRLELTLVDRQKGSVLNLGKLVPVDVVAEDNTRAHVSAELFAPGALLILSDLMDRDGSVLHFNLKATCGYMMGLADLDLNMDIDLPLSEKGNNVTFDKNRTSASEMMIGASGFRQDLLPEDWTVTFRGDGKSVRLDMESEGDGFKIIMKSDGNLERDMKAVYESEDFTADVHSGSPVNPDRKCLGMLISVLNLMESI